MNYAGFFVRFFSVVVDSIILSSVIFLALFLSPPATSLEYCLFSIFCPFLAICYYIFFAASKMQGTPGKRLLDVYIGNEDKTKISFLRSLGRYVVLSISLAIFPIAIISGLMVIFSQEKAGIHDVISKTRVFRGKPVN